MTDTFTLTAPFAEGYFIKNAVRRILGRDTDERRQRLWRLMPSHRKLCLFSFISSRHR
jgi:hypothetical protein